VNDTKGLKGSVVVLIASIGAKNPTLLLLLIYEMEKFDKAVAKALVVIPLPSYISENAELEGSVVRFWSLI
jgi:hypothetical protein